MLPLYLLTNAKGQQLRIELKSGEIVEGELTNVDNWMNLTLSNVSEFKSSDNSPQGEVSKSSEIYLKGIYIKYIKLQDDIISTVKQQINSNQNNNGNKNFRKYNNRNYNNQGPSNRRNNYGRDNYSRDMNRRHNNSNNNNSNNRRSYHHHHNNDNDNEDMRPSVDGTGGYVQHHTIFNNDYDNKVEF